MGTEQGQVKLPRESFKKAKDDYRDWRWSFIRELIQNSYDAQVRNIRFTVHDEAGRGEPNGLLYKIRQRHFQDARSSLHIIDADTAFGPLWRNSMSFAERGTLP